MIMCDVRMLIHLTRNRLEDECKLYGLLSPLRSVLGSQLLSCSDYDCERAIRTMELLKLRFGEPAMHACEVWCAQD